jgi:hypothetical protein
VKGAVRLSQFCSAGNGARVIDIGQGHREPIACQPRCYSSADPTRRTSDQGDTNVRFSHWHLRLSTHPFFLLLQI